MSEFDAALTPLHGQNPLGRFSNRAQDYARYRPTYPPEAIATILAGLDDGALLRIADVGAGTGISSRLLAEHGATVWAVEPNAAMRSAALPHPQVEFRDASAEHTGLPDRSVAVVTCCQAFHWFDAIATLPEFHRILKPGGRVALMWNDRNVTDAFTGEYTDILRQASDKGFFDRPDRKSAQTLETSTLFKNFRTHQFTNPYPLDLDGLMGLALSASYVSKQAEAQTQLFQALQALYERWHRADPASVRVSYTTKLYLADAVEL